MRSVGLLSTICSTVATEARALDLTDAILSDDLFTKISNKGLKPRMIVSEC